MRTIEEFEEDTYWDDRGKKGVPPGMVPNLLDPHLRLSWHFLPRFPWLSAAATYCVS